MKSNLPDFRLGMFSMLFLCCFIVTASASFSENTALNQVFRDALGSKSLSRMLPSDSEESGLNETCLEPGTGYGTLKSCLAKQCVSVKDVAHLYNVSPSSLLPKEVIERMAPAILYGLLQPTSCKSHVSAVNQEKPSPKEVWGYSFLFVSLINLCSLAGALILPCMKMAAYKIILMFLVALAVGTLVGSGLLVLIPEALELTGGEGQEAQMFIWKMTTVMGGIYLFFITERIMRMVNTWRESKKNIKRKQEHVMGTFYPADPPENPITKLKDLSSYPAGDSVTPCSIVSYNSQARICDATESGETGEGSTGVDNYGSEEKTNGHTPQHQPSPPPPQQQHGHQHSHQPHVAPVAYMIVFGDALHNFIDGLSIGAAFSDNTFIGISVSVAVMCEELPHELGDFAILLNSGMRLRKAVMYNFLSSLSCYFGLIIGILLGENTTANTWIFAIAGGMFLYISLVDMLPEMNSAAETEAGREFGEKKTFLLQNLGLLVGYGIILLLVVYGGQIRFGSA